jgi:hypothetical protein
MEKCRKIVGCRVQHNKVDESECVEVIGEEESSSRFFFVMSSGAAQQRLAKMMILDRRP